MAKSSLSEFVAKYLGTKPAKKSARAAYEDHRKAKVNAKRA